MGLISNKHNGSQEAIIITTVGMRLKIWRKNSKLKLVQLSKKICISQGSISDLENDKSLPSAMTLANLCKFSNININWLLTGYGPMIRKEGVSGGKITFPNIYEELLAEQKLIELIEIVIRAYLNKHNFQPVEL